MRLANGPVLNGTSSHQPSTSPDSHRAHDLRQELDAPLDRVLTLNVTRFLGHLITRETV